MVSVMIVVGCYVELEESDLDRDIGLRAGRHPEKGAQAGNRALHHFTDFEPHSF